VPSPAAAAPGTGHAAGAPPPPHGGLQKKSLTRPTAARCSAACGARHLPPMQAWCPSNTRAGRCQGGARQPARLGGPGFGPLPGGVCVCVCGRYTLGFPPSVARFFSGPPLQHLPSLSVHSQYKPGSAFQRRLFPTGTSRKCLGGGGSWVRLGACGRLAIGLGWAGRRIGLLGGQVPAWGGWRVLQRSSGEGRGSRSHGPGGGLPAQFSGIPAVGWQVSAQAACRRGGG
jgi:hypothetical protein